MAELVLESLEHAASQSSNSTALAALTIITFAREGVRDDEVS
jgi:hypothetical protein